MLKLPKLTIFAFVVCAIACAALIHHFENRSQGSAELASEADPLVDQIKNLVERTSRVNLGRELSALGAFGALDAFDCQCTLAGIETPMFQFEDVNRCSAERLYLENDLNRLPSVYRDSRTRSPGDFPRVCMTYIMRKNFEGVEGKETNALSTCKTPNGKPSHGNYPACVTEKYVNATYNYFTDVTSCLGIPQRDFLPKLYLESGLHVNSINTKGFDGGLAQLTGPAIEHAKLEFPSIRRDVANSTSPACKRLAPYMQNLKPAESGPEFRCQLMTVPGNPLLSIVTMAAKVRQDTYAVNLFIAKPEYNIIARMTKLGLKPTDYDSEQLMQMMIALGYNAGAKSAVIALSNYLKVVEDSGRKLKKEDFNIGGESIIYSSVNNQTMALTRSPSNDDEKWASRYAKFEERMKELETLRVPYKPKIQKVQLRNAQGKAYDSYQLQINPSELSFSAYMQLYQSSGAAGYLNFVARRADDLNNQFKAGTCVPESYLAL